MATQHLDDCLQIWNAEQLLDHASASPDSLAGNQQRECRNGSEMTNVAGVYILEFVH